MTTDYQADGFVREFSTKALAEANRQIRGAINAIPDALRNQYRSQIRALRSQGGYAWYVVRK